MRLLCVTLLVSGLVVACDSKPAPNPFESQPTASEPPPIQAPPKQEGPPEFAVLGEGPKIGWTYLLLDKPDGKTKLAAEVDKAKAYVSGKDVPLRADRQAKLAYVAEMMRALETAGATGVVVSTETRPEFPKTVKFSPLADAKSAPSCSVVAKVLSERRNAVWSLAGGTAIRSPKGLAGPDMAMTEDSLTGAAHHCKDSDLVFVSADDDVEWGLVYDLSAATQSLEKAKFGKVVLIEPAPVAGRPVKLD